MTARVRRKLRLAAGLCGLGCLLLVSSSVWAQTVTPSQPAIKTDTNVGVNAYQENQGKSNSAVSELRPILSVPVPTVQLRTPQFLTIGDQKFIDIPWIADYIAGAYQYGVGIGAVIAVVMMMIGGFQYVMAGGDTSRVMKAKERISDAVLGLSILLGSFLILNTLSPDLVSLPAIRVLTIRKVSFSPEEQYDPGDSVGQVIAGAACKSVEECEKLCFKTPPTKADSSKGIKGNKGVRADQSTWPAGNQKTIPEGQTIALKSGPGMVAFGGVRGTQAMQNYLLKTGIAAQKKDPSYVIYVGSVWRPMDRQINLVCTQFEKYAMDPCVPDASGMCRKLPKGKTAPGPNESKRGNEHPKFVLGNGIAWPGNSNHGSGRAADVRLCNGDCVGDPQKALTCAGLACNQEGVAANAAILRSIMEGEGGTMLSIEIWHYEIR